MKQCFTILILLMTIHSGILLCLSHPEPPPQLFKTSSEEKPFIQGMLTGQLGNQMFEIAAAVSLALDNDAEAIFPDLIKNQRWNIPTNYQYVFWRLNPHKSKIKPQFTYSYEPIPYEPILYRPNMILKGLFHSEKFFINNKEKIIELFSPHENILTHIYERHPWIKNAENTVSVHVRAYSPIVRDGANLLPFLGYDYFEKAIMTFPENYTFVVFSNKIAWCKKHLAKIPRNLIFIENQPYYIDFYMMSLCKHHIISNSSFSWWAAYLNQNPEKIVIAPKRWFCEKRGLDTKDIIPDGWHILN